MLILSLCLSPPVDSALLAHLFSRRQVDAALTLIACNLFCFGFCGICVQGIDFLVVNVGELEFVIRGAENGLFKIAAAFARFHQAVLASNADAVMSIVIGTLIFNKSP